MKLSIALTTLLANFATSTPNLCDDVYLDVSGSPYTDASGQTFSRYCEWTGPYAPVWDAEICCTIDDRGAECSKTENAACRSGLKMYCEYGAMTASGSVTCYQPISSMCDAGLCYAPPNDPPDAQAILACCGGGGACQPLAEDAWEACVEGGGSVLWCDEGITNLNGTIDCWD